MNQPGIAQPHRMVMDRRKLLVASLGAGLALRFGGHVTLAQEATAPAAPLTVPANAVAWPKCNLNTASTEQFMSIPGAGERMTREFQEYRPYTNIGQFRGEIGKYVSAEEVAAFETYVFVPVDPNQADTDTFQQLPGVTAEVADALIAGRPYDSAEAFLTTLGQHAPAELVAAAGPFLATDTRPIAT